MSLSSLPFDLEESVGGFWAELGSSDEDGMECTASATNFDSAMSEGPCFGVPATGVERPDGSEGGLAGPFACALLPPLNGGMGMLSCVIRPNVFGFGRGEGAREEEEDCGC